MSQEAVGRAVTSMGVEIVEALAKSMDAPWAAAVVPFARVRLKAGEVDLVLPSVLGASGDDASRPFRECLQRLAPMRDRVLEAAAHLAIALDREGISWTWAAVRVRRRPDGSARAAIEIGNGVVPARPLDLLASPTMVPSGGSVHAHAMTMKPLPPIPPAPRLPPSIPGAPPLSTRSVPPPRPGVSSLPPPSFPPPSRPMPAVRSGPPARSGPPSVRPLPSPRPVARSSMPSRPALGTNPPASSAHTLISSSPPASSASHRPVTPGPPPRGSVRVVPMGSSAAPPSVPSPSGRPRSGADNLELVGDVVVPIVSGSAVLEQRELEETIARAVALLGHKHEVFAKNISGATVRVSAGNQQAEFRTPDRKTHTFTCDQFASYDRRNGRWRWGWSIPDWPESVRAQSQKLYTTGTNWRLEALTIPELEVRNDTVFRLALTCAWILGADACHFVRSGEIQNVLAIYGAR